LPFLAGMRHFCF